MLLGLLPLPPDSPLTAFEKADIDGSCDAAPASRDGVVGLNEQDQEGTPAVTKQAGPAGSADARHHHHPADDTAFARPSSKVRARENEGKEAAAREEEVDIDVLQNQMAQKRANLQVPCSHVCAHAHVGWRMCRDGRVLMACTSAVAAVAHASAENDACGCVKMTGNAVLRPK